MTNACSNNVPRMPITREDKKRREARVLTTTAGGESCQSTMSIFWELSIVPLSCMPRANNPSSIDNNSQKISRLELGRQGQLGAVFGIS
jgi:hypothetical protein